MPRRATEASRRQSSPDAEEIMASDILIVDDEADIRELVAGILDDEGHGPGRRATATRALAEIERRRPALRLPRHLAAGQPARRPRAPRRDQEGASRRAGGHDLRPRQHRDRGLRHQARRLRLHREAVQGGPPGAVAERALEASKLRREVQGAARTIGRRDRAGRRIDAA